LYTDDIFKTRDPNVFFFFLQKSKSRKVTIVDFEFI
jgi:hypothetical protein